MARTAEFQRGHSPAFAALASRYPAGWVFNHSAGRFVPPHAADFHYEHDHVEEHDNDDD